MLSREQLEMELMYLLNGTGVGGNILAHDAAQRAQREQDLKRLQELEKKLAWYREDFEAAAKLYPDWPISMAEGVKCLQQRIAALEDEREGYKAAHKTIRLDNEVVHERLRTLTLALAQAKQRLEQLARLGNGEHYGNSDGNRIAQQALAEIALAVPAAGGGEDTK